MFTSQPHGASLPVSKLASSSSSSKSCPQLTLTTQVTHNTHYQTGFSHPKPTARDFVIYRLQRLTVLHHTAAGFGAFSVEKMEGELGLQAVEQS